MRVRNFLNKRKNQKKNEKGAVVIEATLSLSAFMFFIVTILSIVNICILQQKVGLALNESAKEMAQYAYIYSLSGLNGIQKENYAGGESARNDIGSVVSGLSEMNKSISAFAEGDAEFNETYSSVTGTGENIANTVKEAAGEGSAWVMSFLRMMGNEVTEEVKSQICGAIAKGLVQKNLVSYEGGSADEYLKSKGITEGIDGIHFDDSVFMLNGSNDIILVADYHVHVITLLDHEITLHFRQAAVTRAWEASPLESGIAGKEEGSETPDSGEKPAEGEETVSGAETGEGEDPQTKEPELTAEEIRQKMIEEYGEGAILEIEKGMDTSGFTEDDWRYQLYLYAASDVDEIDGIPIINGLVNGKMPLEDYVNARIDSVQLGTGQGGKKEDYLFVLGLYKATPNYIETANKHGSNYFDMGDNWKKIQDKYDFSDEDMFEMFNRPVLDEAIQRGQIIVYAHNPEDAKEGTALYKEWEYLKKTYGYTKVVKDKDGDFYYPQ